MFAIILAVLLFILMYYVLIKPYNYWKEQNVPYLRPWPLVGNFGPSVFQTMNVMENENYIYKLAGNRRYIGIYQFSQPLLLLLDVDLIKQVTIKEFDTFPDHRTFGAPETDPLINKGLFSLTRERGWQKMRATLSPSFTSSKMKMMFSLLQECTDKYIQYYLEKNENIVTLEMKDSLSRVTSDIIATTALGIDCNSLENPQNEVFLKVKSMSNFSGIRSAIFFLAATNPNLLKFFNIKLLSTENRNFFRNLIHSTIDYREVNKIVRQDMLHLLMKLKRGIYDDEDENQSDVVDSGFAVAQETDWGKQEKEGKIKLMGDDLVAQAAIFLFAGFESVSIAMCHAVYELAINFDIQQRLKDEIDETLQKDTQITYEQLLKMKYLDCIVTESLRLRPPTAFTDRKSARPFRIDAKLPDETPIDLPAGTVCLIPIWAIHRDPKHFPNPEKFDPDRFNDENKHKIKPFTYLPFGTGPRNCIASRFAIMEIKLIIVKIVQHFEIVPVDKTAIPLVMSKKSLNMLPDGGLWLGLKRRKATI